MPPGRAAPRYARWIYIRRFRRAGAVEDMMMTLIIFDFAAPSSTRAAHYCHSRARTRAASATIDDARRARAQNQRAAAPMAGDVDAGLMARSLPIEVDESMKSVSVVSALRI